VVVAVAVVVAVVVVESSLFLEVERGDAATYPWILSLISILSKRKVKVNRDLSEEAVEEQRHNMAR
jgi:hypothetical protein